MKFQGAIKMSKEYATPQSFSSSWDLPEMEEKNPDWDYAPLRIYLDYGYTEKEVIDKEVPTWDELKEEHSITIRGKKVRS